MNRRETEQVMTLCIIYQHPRILLGYKKRGFWVGCWAGFGGKVEEGETIEESAKRELKEESGLSATDLQKVGELNFEFKNSGERLKVHVFKVTDFSGEEKETDEMKPQWFNEEDIPFDQMWSDDKFWMPLFLAGKKFKGRFLFGKGDRVLEHRLKKIK